MKQLNKTKPLPEENWLLTDTTPTHPQQPQQHQHQHQHQQQQQQQHQHQQHNEHNEHRLCSHASMHFSLPCPASATTFAPINAPSAPRVRTPTPALSAPPPRQSYRLRRPSAWLVVAKVLVGIAALSVLAAGVVYVTIGARHSGRQMKAVLVWSIVSAVVGLLACGCWVYLRGERGMSTAEEGIELGRMGA